MLLAVAFQQFTGMPPEAKLLAGYNDLTRLLPITVSQKQVTVFDAPLMADSFRSVSVGEDFSLSVVTSDLGSI